MISPSSLPLWLVAQAAPVALATTSPVPAAAPPVPAVTEIFGLPIGTVSLVVLLTLGIGLISVSPRLWEAWTGMPPGSRAVRRARLARLAPHVRREFYEHVLGMPPAMELRHDVEVPNWTERNAEGGDPEAVNLYALTELVWADRWFFVQAMADEQDMIVGFAVTTRHHKFRPTFTAPPGMPRPGWRRWRRDPAWVRVKLGRTTFARAAPNVAVPVVWCDQGASWWDYSEMYDFAAPGGYAEYVCASGTNTPVTSLEEPLPGLHLPRHEGVHSEQFGEQDEDGENTLVESLLPPRQRAVTTWAVTTWPLRAQDWPSQTWGPGRVRTQFLP